MYSNTLKFQNIITRIVNDVIDVEVYGFILHVYIYIYIYTENKIFFLQMRKTNFH